MMAGQAGLDTPDLVRKRKQSCRDHPDFEKVVELDEHPPDQARVWEQTGCVPLGLRRREELE